MGRRLLHLPSADWSWRQVLQALRGDVSPDSVRRLEDAAARALGVEVIAFGSARAALAAVLMVGQPRIRRVVVPAYTCVAVPNAVRTAGCSIEWVDIEGPNLDLEEAARRVGPNTAVIAQHTYGVPIDPAGLWRLAEQGAFVIEDRTHRFDARDLVGSCAVFSLEQSKVVSAGQGGLVWAHDPELRSRLRAFQSRLQPVATAVARRILWTSAVQVAIARSGSRLEPLSSLARRLAQRLPFASWSGQTPDEIAGGPVHVVSMHPAFASVGIESMRRVEANLEHRRHIGAVYRSTLPDLVPKWARADLPYVRQPILVPNADQASQQLRALGLDLGPRWFEAPIHPRGSEGGYPPGLAPNAERLASRVLSLPTHAGIDPQTAARVASLIAARFA